MFDITIKTIAALAMVAALSACDATPSAPIANAPLSAATTAASASASANIISRDEATVPHNFVVYASCANGGQGEVLGAQGTLQYKGHWITTAKGTRQHNVINMSFTGTATGEDTGDVYDITTKEFSQTNISYGTDGIQDSGEELQRIRIQLRSRATGALIVIDLTGRFVQAANGEFILSGWTGTARCN